MPEIDDRIIEIIGLILQVSPEVLSAQSGPASISSWDSVRHIELLLALEQEFAVRFPDMSISDQTSVGQIVESLKRLRGV